MKYILPLVLICGIHLSLLSQHIVEGRILDDVDEALVGATVVFLDSEDSSMVSFAISDNVGAFMLEVDELGSYVMQVSFVAYSSIQVPVEIQEGKSTQLGSFRLAPSSEVLQEVTIKAEHIPMGVIGDTISYNAAAFKTKPGATVEDLLKKLPGVEVGRDGSIKAMGENVQNVLVDGKEFFGDDPKIATKNLEAEAVDKVQVFDKKSEIAEFTGIDDGEEEKTINLKLKEEYKNGGFGNASLSGGTESIYDGKFKMSISALWEGSEMPSQIIQQISTSENLEAPHHKVLAITFQSILIRTLNVRLSEVSLSMISHLKVLIIR